jgi:hypothetical protein
LCRLNCCISFDRGLYELGPLVLVAELQISQSLFMLVKPIECVD